MIPRSTAWCVPPLEGGTITPLSCVIREKVLELSVNP